MIRFFLFQNYLSSLSTAQTQLFLDELTFRECLGHYPLAAFDALTKATAAQTKHAGNSSESLEDRCAGVANDPFADWRITDREPKVQSNNNQYSNSKKRPADVKIGSSYLNF